MNINPNSTEEEKAEIYLKVLASIMQDSLNKLCEVDPKFESERIKLALFKAVADNLGGSTIMNKFIENTYGLCWTKIKEKDEKFFIENSGEIFKMVPAANISIFKDIFETKNKDGELAVSQKTKDDLWTYLRNLTIVCMKYIHRERKKNGMSTYTTSFYPDVDLVKIVLEWDVTSLKADMIQNSLIE